MSWCHHIFLLGFIAGLRSQLPSPCTAAPATFLLIGSSCRSRRGRCLCFSFAGQYNAKWIHSLFLPAVTHGFRFRTALHKLYRRDARLHILHRTPFHIFHGRHLHLFFREVVTSFIFIRREQSRVMR